MKPYQITNFTATVISGLIWNQAKFYLGGCHEIMTCQVSASIVKTGTAHVIFGLNILIYK